MMNNTNFSFLRNWNGFSLSARGILFYSIFIIFIGFSLLATLGSTRPAGIINEFIFDDLFCDIYYSTMYLHKGGGLAGGVLSSKRSSIDSVNNNTVINDSEFILLKPIHDKNYIKIKLFNESIKKILIKNHFDESNINQIYKEINIIGLLLAIIKSGELENIIKDFENILFNQFNKLGIRKNIIKKWFNECQKEFDELYGDIKWTGLNNFNNDYNDKKLDEFLDKIKNIHECKGIDLSMVISNKNLNKLIRMFIIFNRINNRELNGKIEIFKNQIIDNLNKHANEEYLKVRGNKKKILKPINYYKRFSSVYIEYVKILKTELIKWIYENEFNSLFINIEKISEILHKDYKEYVDILFKKDYKLPYRMESFKNVNIKKNNYYNEILKEYDLKNVNILNELYEKYKSINLNEFTNVKKIEKFDIEMPLMKGISEIINSSVLDNKSKQFAIEKLCLDYDLNWFDNEMKNSLDTRSTILHDIHSKMDNGLNFIIKPYTTYKCRKIKLLYDKIYDNINILDTNKKKLSELKCLLALLILGNKIVISNSFKLIIELLINTENNMSMNRTEFIFKLGERLFKFTKHFLNKIEEDENDKKDDKSKKDKYKKTKNKDLENLFSIISLNEIKKLLNYITEEDKFEIGDSVLRIMIDKTEVVTSKVISGRFNRELMVGIDSDYINKLKVSSINVTQLPMLTVPNKPFENGKYLPYLHGETSHIYNTFDTIVKKKYNLKFEVENQDTLIESVSYLNNIPYIINNDMLNFILDEWKNEKSIFFKGENRYLKINEDDNTHEKEKKIIHNSKYWRFLNIIDIATLYRNSVFYLPTFADFRGRIYTLSNYLSYQGNDLSRSLLAFNMDEYDNKKKILSKEGYKCLLFYFANLAGKSNLNYEKRIEWSEQNIMIMYKDYLENKDKFLNDIVVKFKEPLQFLSIMFALVKAIDGVRENKPVIINNPILFDASCNGIQHLSAITRELNDGILTNLVSLDKNDIVEKDYYLYASNIVQEEIDKCDNEILRSVKITRKFIKKKVMTLGYNITKYGIIEQLKNEDFIYDKNMKNYILTEDLSKESKIIYLSSKHVNYLGEIVYNTLINKLPSLRLLSNYLDELINIILKLELPVVWITPIGLKIPLSPIKFKKKITSSSLIPYGKPVTISIPTEKIDTRKIRTSLMPNLIHSLDASNVHLLCMYLNEKKIPLYTVHDCFASTANNMSILEQNVKAAFIEIYFQDETYIEKMHNSFIDQIKSFSNKIVIIDGKEFITIKKEMIKIPEIPESFLDKSKLNIFIEGIKQSKFFIS